MGGLDCSLIPERFSWCFIYIHWDVVSSVLAWVVSYSRGSLVVWCWLVNTECYSVRYRRVESCFYR